MAGTGGDFSAFVDPHDEILWKEAGLYISDDALRCRFGIGGNNSHGVTKSCSYYPSDVAQVGLNVPAELTYERDILSIVDNCLSDEVTGPCV